MPVFPPSGGGSGDGITALTGDGTATGPGSAVLTLSGDAVDNLDLATALTKGLLSSSDFTRLRQLWRTDWKAGTALSDANATIDPVTSGISLLILDVPLTTTRTI